MKFRVLTIGIALLSATILGGCDAGELSSLRDLSRPYAGEYECTKLQLGGEDMLPNYEYLKLELGFGGDFRVFYRGKDNSKGEFSGTYLMNEDTLTFFSQEGGKESSFVFPYRKGAVEMLLTFREKPLFAEFSSN